MLDGRNNPKLPVLFIFSSSLVYSIALNTLKPSIELVFIPIIPHYVVRFISARNCSDWL